LNEVCLDIPPESFVVLLLLISGVGGKGPFGGGNGAVPALRSGEAGIGFSLDNLDCPTLILLDEADGGGDWLPSYSPTSSGLGGKLVEGGGLLGAIMDSLNPLPAIEVRLDLGTGFGTDESTE
jgi:hypothetical protein